MDKHWKKIMDDMKSAISLGETEIPIGSMTARVEISPDEDPIDPAKNGEIGILRLFHSKEAFHDGAKSLFGKSKEIAIGEMVHGSVFWHKNTPWIGIEKYSHSGDVYAACRHGNFPDRQFDVSPIVGFWSPTPDKHKQSAFSKAKALKKKADSPECPACGVGNSYAEHPCRECGTTVEGGNFLAEAEAILRKEMEGDISVWNQYVNGDIWVFSATLEDEDGSEVDHESGYGFYGSDAAGEAAEEIVTGWKEKYGDGIPETNEKQEDENPEKKRSAA